MRFAIEGQGGGDDGSESDSGGDAKLDRLSRLGAAGGDWLVGRCMGADLLVLWGSELVWSVVLQQVKRRPAKDLTTLVIHWGDRIWRTNAPILDQYWINIGSQILFVIYCRFRQFLNCSFFRLQYPYSIHHRIGVPRVPSLLMRSCIRLAEFDVNIKSKTSCKAVGFLIAFSIDAICQGLNFQSSMLL